MWKFVKKFFFETEPVPQVGPTGNKIRTEYNGTQWLDDMKFRNEIRLQSAIEDLGDKWILSKSNQVKRLSKSEQKRMFRYR